MMGLFSKQNAAGDPPPFAAARLGPVLEGVGINFGVDDDGTHLGDWDNCRIFFDATGEQNELMHFRAYWDFRPPADRFTDLVLAANEWNVGRRWPRMLVVPAEDDDTGALVGTDLIVDLETGATDAFLTQQVQCFVTTTLDGFEFIETTFPEHTTWHNMGAEQPEE